MKTGSNLNGYSLQDIAHKHFISKLILITVFDTGERNVLFNNAFNTFYLRLYGIKHMVKDHSDSEKGNPLPLHRLLFDTYRRMLCVVNTNLGGSPPADSGSITTLSSTPFSCCLVQRYVLITDTGLSFRLTFSIEVCLKAHTVHVKPISLTPLTLCSTPTTNKQIYRIYTEHTKTFTKTLN